jgi:hypothetical protein
VQELSPPAWLDGVEGTPRSPGKPEETDAVSREDGLAASAFVEHGLHSAASEMETNRKSPRSGRAILERLERWSIYEIVPSRTLVRQQLTAMFECLESGGLSRFPGEKRKAVDVELPGVPLSP